MFGFSGAAVSVAPSNVTSKPCAIIDRMAAFPNRSRWQRQRDVVSLHADATKINRTWRMVAMPHLSPRLARRQNSHVGRKSHCAKSAAMRESVHASIHIFGGRRLLFDRGPSAAGRRRPFGQAWTQNSLDDLKFPRP